jgi:hypothetical protein
MAKSSLWRGPRPLTLEEQIYRMSLLHPSFRLRRKQRQVEATWVGCVQPTALSDVYTVSVRHRTGWCPEVRVVSPVLRLRPDAKTLPHVYGDGSLCLHTQADWQPSLFVADFVVPWISSWLYFYEVWFATGFWEGRGTHPALPEHGSMMCQGN